MKKHGNHLAELEAIIRAIAIFKEKGIE